MTMINLLTLNARKQMRTDGRNAFVRRRDAILRFMEGQVPDVLALQEITGGMLEDFREGLSGYAFVEGSGRPGGRGDGNPIAYRADTLVLEDAGTFWLSPNPQRPGSRFAVQSPDPRVCTWAVFQSRDGVRFRYYNTHLDHLSGIARARGLGVIFERVTQDQRDAWLPMFIGGDMNFTPRSALYTRCLQQRVQGRRLVDLTESIRTTFHGFGMLSGPLKFDYVFADSQTACGALSVRSLRTADCGRYLSDHDAIRVCWQP